ncbi:tRNA (cytidine(56)-2'-O)-methyltransferase [Candidatus Micrarchaeota archaeon]|nr:tRNA (cytidine(56)-2'-O)-methyltransferase [Candidatus Micrarchaeota archaeon]
MITVLRLGHRKDRDKRASMHVALVARALGGKKIIFCGEADDDLLQRVHTVSRKWGGRFTAEYATSYRTVLKSFKGARVHLTMYGIPLEKSVANIRKARDILVVVGSEKVPADVYQLCDCNVAVTNQPHSEIAALALFFREVEGKKTLSKRFGGGELSIFPSESGKNVTRNK